MRAENTVDSAAARMASGCRKLLDVIEDLDDVQSALPQRRNTLNDGRSAMPGRAARMTVLVIGGGGREHALAWKLAAVAQGADAFSWRRATAVPRLDPKLTNVALTDHAALADFAQRGEGRGDRRRSGGAARRGPGRRVPGPPACAFSGPTQAAAQLESSKAFAKAFMQKPQAFRRRPSPPSPIATAAHAHVDAETAARPGVPIVIKADGLAAGKGVVVAMPPLPEAHAGDRLDAQLPPTTNSVVQHNAGHRAGRDRAIPRRRGSQLHRAVRRQERALAGHQPGPQAPAATPTRARTPVAWAPIRRRRW